MATSNFIDTATIWLHAGKGGDGAVTFHREKFVAAGGPDGGDGGRGGDIIFVADDNLSTLMDFRYKRKYTAPDGENGRAKRMSGADGDDLVIRVPRGTVLKEAETDLVVADLTGSEPVVVARGGRGGWGNSHFATPTRQIPKFAKPGLPGEDMHLKLELKVIADVGLIGFPNVGKSTLISIISAARPKIANYHFTTLTPVLGVVRVGPEQSFVCADIPGLIEGAAEGVGLGHDFLRHVERCRLLLHVVDVSGCEGRDPKADFEQINHELAGFSAELADRPQIVLGNKCDIASPEQVEEFKQYVEAKGLTFLPISAATRQGVDNLPALVYNRLKDLPPVKVYEAEYKRPDKNAQPTRPFTVERTGDHEFTVDAPWLERILAGTNVEDYESLQYFQTQLGDSGILDELVAQGVEEEDTIKIGEYEFDYLYYVVENMLFTQKSEVDIHEMSPLALAFVGDAVLELLVRARLVGTTRLQPNRLHTVATHYVSAHAQNLELDIIEPMLTDAEAAVLRRGKNASKATVAKHATVQEYRASTGCECLLGWLYLQGRNDRIEELFNAMWDGYKPE